MIDLTQQLLERYAAKQAERKISALTETDGALRAYRQAAAVLDCFQPEKLIPFDTTYEQQSARSVLFDDLVPASGRRAEGLFTLKFSVRREVLGTFSTRNSMRQALNCNPVRVKTPLQTMWEAYLVSGTMPLPESLGYQQLLTLCQLCSWMEGLDPTLPTQARLQALLRKKRILASFEHLVAANFTGRINELAQIREHIGLLPPATTIDAIRSQLSRWFKPSRATILAIHGPGGIGKSALVGRLLWEHTQSDVVDRIPFAYLAFDQSTLRIENPYTILVEMTAQFELQMPDKVNAITRFRERINQFRGERSALGDRKVVLNTRQARIGEVLALDLSLYEAFVELMNAISIRRTPKDEVYNVPVLLVLDTFEEVQYRDRESLTEFWRMLDFLQQKFPSLRVILCGRAPVANSGISPSNLTELKLAELSSTDRILLLERLGVTDTNVGRAVAKQIGGNPLSLQLAANIITTDATTVDAQGIKDLTTRNWLLFQVDEQLIQGQLYRRILDHIHDEDVRKLAHPGMILRRIDSDVILNLLAPSCQLEVKTLQEAQRLFEELKREHALVQAGEPGTLIYRPEIRGAIMHLLKQDRPREVKALHRQAVAYYYSFKENDKYELQNRAEELYHRLALGEDDFATLDRRWLSGLERSIAANQEDYPDQMQVWLASRMNLEVSRDVFDRASTADWERNITRKVKRGLSSLQVSEALNLLNERTERTVASPLFALEAKAHLLQKNLDKAWAVLEAGVQRVWESSNRGRLAELFWLQAQVVLLRGETGQADELLSRAQQCVEKASNSIPQMHILCHRVLLREHYPSVYSPSSAVPLRLRLSIVSGSLDEKTAYSARLVVEMALYLLHDEFPVTTVRLQTFVPTHASTTAIPPDVLTSENLMGLDEYRDKWEEDNDITEESAA